MGPIHGEFSSYSLLLTPLLTMIKSHLQVYQASTSRFSSSPLFRIPEVCTSTGNVLQWETITYQQFEHDVELYARHWSRVLRSNGIPRRSVVGMWYVHQDAIILCVEVLTTHNAGSVV